MSRQKKQRRQGQRSRGAGPGAGRPGGAAGRSEIKGFLERETRLVPHRHGQFRFLLAYPAPYAVGMSSLGFLTIHREIAARPNWSVERCFFPSSGAADPDSLRAWESGDPAAAFDAVGLSISHELEIPALADLLRGLGVPPRRSDRAGTNAPLVVIGGPLTGINPRPLAPLADLIIVGEADEAIHLICAGLEAGLEPDNPGRLAKKRGCWWPARSSRPPAPLRLAVEALPAYADCWSPDATLHNMALVEVARGCSRACHFCATCRQAAGPARTVSARRILAAIPESAPRVGLVGSAVSDHPELEEILAEQIDAGREVGLSSVRTDRVTDALVELLAKGGLRTLTLGVDGLSERLRRGVRKGVTAGAIHSAVDAAARGGLRRVKLYQLVGFPDETDADAAEFVSLTAELSRKLPISVTLSPFVPKPGTALADAAQRPYKEVERQLKAIAAQLRSKGRAKVRPGSARWAFIEALIARGSVRTGEVLLDAWEAGGGFARYRQALTTDDEAGQ